MGSGIVDIVVAAAAVAAAAVVSSVLYHMVRTNVGSEYCMPSADSVVYTVGRKTGVGPDTAGARQSWETWRRRGP